MGYARKDRGFSVREEAIPGPSVGRFRGGIDEACQGGSEQRVQGAGCCWVCRPLARRWCFGLARVFKSSNGWKSRMPDSSVLRLGSLIVKPPGATRGGGGQEWSLLRVSRASADGFPCGAGKLRVAVPWGRRCPSGPTRTADRWSRLVGQRLAEWVVLASGEEVRSSNGPAARVAAPPPAERWSFFQSCVSYRSVGSASRSA